MNYREHLLELHRHMEWADATVWEAVLAHPPAAADGKLLKYFHHLHITQHAFLRVWRNEPRDTPYPEFTDARSLMAWGKAWFPGALTHLSALTSDELGSPMPVPWSKMVGRKIGRPPGATTLGDTVLQVAMHSQYHRGQINARLKETGGEPPLVDYIGWLWLGRPPAAWPR